MKKFNYRAFNQYRYDVSVSRDDMTRFYPHVINIANTFPRDSIAIGVLNIEDLIQAGNIGLVEAWNKVDWNRIKKSKNPDGEIWTYLKTRIKFAIRREIDNAGAFIKVPRRDLEQARKNLTHHDKILVNMFPQFFDEEMWIEDDHPWHGILLEELINDELYRVELNYDNIDILLKFYGIGFEKKSRKELAKEYNKHETNIGVILNRTRKKLDNEHFKNIIENFYKNM